LSSLLRPVYCLRIQCPHGSSAKPARGATMNTLQQSSEVVAAAAVADSDTPEVGLFSSSSSLLLLLLPFFRPAAVGTPYERRQNGWLHTETAGDYKRAAVESWQSGFNSLIVQHVRFFLGPTDVQPVAICLIWCRVVRSRDFSTPRSHQFALWPIL